MDGVVESETEISSMMTEAKWGRAEVWNPTGWKVVAALGAKSATLGD